MKKTIEYSDDGLEWTDPPSSRFTRLIIDFEEKDTLEEISFLVKNNVYGNTNSRLEYSTDKGFSYAPLRINQSDPSGRIGASVIADLIVKRYQVRFLEITSRDNVVHGGRSSGSLLESASKARFFEKEVRSEKTKVTIYKRNGLLTWKNYTRADDRDPDTAGVIECENIYALGKPNINRVVSIEGVPIEQMPSGEEYKMPGLFRGHIYIIDGTVNNLPDLSTIQMWTSFRDNLAVCVKSARLFDEETHNILGKIPLGTILSGKYAITEDNYKKLGNTWYARSCDIPHIANRISEIGGIVYLNAPIDVDNDPLRIYSTALVKEKDKIMDLGKLIETKMNTAASKEELTSAVVSAISYRDSLIDSLKELNGKITEARERIAEFEADETMERLTRK